MDPTPENLRIPCGSYHDDFYACPRDDERTAAADRIEALERLVRAMWEEVPEASSDARVTNRADWRWVATSCWGADALELARVLESTVKRDDEKVRIIVHLRDIVERSGRCGWWGGDQPGPGEQCRLDVGHDGPHDFGQPARP